MPTRATLSALLAVAPLLLPQPHRVGAASWYGGWFHGRMMADGCRYDQHALTAASPTLPLGQRIVVTNLRNGLRVTLTVTDRGPFVGDRILDLSLGAAQRLHAVQAGVIPVAIELLPGISKHRCHER